MASMHAARLGGDRYQHHYSWWLILALKLPEENVEKVIVEDGQAGQVDDITVHYKPEAALPDRFYQVKYHVDQSEPYSSNSLITSKKRAVSLLEKFWSTWKKLREEIPERSIELYLISTWTWDGKDPLGKWVSGVTDRIKVDDFMAESPRSKIGKIREDWRRVLGTTKDEDFRAFIDCLHFRFGYTASVLLGELVSERMKRLRLKTDPKTLLAIQGIVSDWIITNKNDISLEMLNDALRKYDFYLPEAQERHITIHMETIAKTPLPEGLDYYFDWLDYFVDGNNPDEKGHQLKDPANWQKLLQELYIRKSEMNQKTIRLLKVSGKSRLSAWFAFGYVFSSVTDYVIDFALPDQYWRTDAEANQDFSLSVVDELDPSYNETISGMGDTVAIGISSTEAILDKDMHRYLQRQDEKIAAVLLLHSNLSRLRNAGDAVALANSVKKYASAFVKQHDARRLLLFYSGPAAGACFIGYRLNKVCSETQIMEYQPGQGYSPSFLLR